MLYAYSHPDYGVRRELPELAGPVMTPAAELRVGLVEMLRRVDIFAGLPDSDLRELAELGAVRTIPDGEGLGAEGQIGDSIYVVLEGRAQLSANSTIGRLTARMAGPGESFPLAALLGDGRLITSVKAATEMKVWRVDRGTLTEYFDGHCEVASHVYEKAGTILAERYRSTIWRLTRTTADVVKGDAFWANV
jgi:CRP-like cAMP-binding protein